MGDKFQGYEGCPSCGSKDNLGVWTDGKYCFGCGYTDGVKGYGKDSSGSRRPVIKWPPNGYDFTAIPHRGITRDTCVKYGVASRGPFTLFPSSDRRGFKERNFLFSKLSRKLHMRIEGSYKGLFGLDTIHTKKTMAIAFGEFDALSVYQATGIPCISPCNGDKSLVSGLKSCWSSLEDMEKIVLLPDQDESCQSVIPEVVELLGEDRCYVASLSYKDPNEYSQRNEDYLLKKAFWAARPMGSSLLYDSFEGMFETDYGIGTLTGISPLDKLSHGFKGGEVSYFIGQPKSGKTSLVQYITYSLAQKGVKVGTVCLEGGHKSYLTNLGHMFIGGNVASLSVNDQHQLQSVMKENLELATIKGIQDHGKIIKAMRALVKAGDCRVIVFDNLTSAGNPMKLFESSSQLVLELDDLAQELNVPVLVIAHVNRMSYNEPPSLGSATGTGHIERFAYSLFSVFREKGASSARIECLANRRVGSEGEGIFYAELNKNTYRYKFSDVMASDKWSKAREYSSKGGK